SVRRAGVAVSVRTQGSARPLSPAIDLAAYRIVQEALTNVLRHAPGASVAVDLRYAEERLEIDVLSDGPEPAHTRPAGSGHGLAGMRERAAAAGGGVSAGPEGGGFAVHAWLPARA